MATENDKVNTGALTTLVFVGLFATLSIALAVTALVRYSVEGVTTERQTLARQEFRELSRAQIDKLAAPPAWTDKGKGLVSIPIDRAKGKVLSELARDPASATPPPAEPAPSPAPADSAGATGEIQMQDDPTPPASAAPSAAAPAKNEHAALDQPKPAPSAPAPTAPAVKSAAPPPAPTAPAPVAPTTAKPAPATTTTAAPKPTDG
jgi:hypothetical protein